MPHPTCYCPSLDNTTITSAIYVFPQVCMEGQCFDGLVIHPPRLQRKSRTKIISHDHCNMEGVDSLQKTNGRENITDSSKRRACFILAGQRPKDHFNFLKRYINPIHPIRNSLKKQKSLYKVLTPSILRAHTGAIGLTTMPPK